MWFSTLIAPIANLFTKGLDIVDKFVLDKDKANELKVALQSQMLQIAHNELAQLLQGQTQIILAEAKGDSWLQRNWRPILMMTIILIIFNNYVAAPYIMLFCPGKALALELPGWMGALLTTGVGGYIGARTIEKIKGVTNSLFPGGKDA